MSTPSSLEIAPVFQPVSNTEEETSSAGHVLSADQLNPKKLEALFQMANELHRKEQDDAEKRELAQRYIGHQICSLFYEPSTRTRLSFEAAAAKLGMGVVGTENAREFSSAAKGETIQDTIKVLNEYNFDVIALRHHETGSAMQAAAVSEAPIINAGDGKGEHPTQALLDAYTIHEHHGRLDNLRIVMGGDLKYGRTVRSLTQLLSNYSGNHFVFTTAPEFQMEDDIKQTLDELEVTYEETTDIHEAFKGADVVYWTRLQKERMETQYQEGSADGADRFVVKKADMDFLPDGAILMHPLPRAGEIDTEVDQDQRAVYFQQAGNGLYVRMALLESILSGDQAVT